ncbi:MAG: ATP cone domain-containing protein, partial [Verrucomicrobiota bacterium]
MKAGHHDVARDYIIYRDQHKALRDDSAQSLKIIREDGIEVRFNPMKIASSLEKAFRSSMEITGFSPKQVVEAINLLTQNVVARALSLSKTGVILSSILIEDEIEQQLMKADFYSVAKHFILHRALLGRQNELKFSYPIPEDRTTREFAILDQELNKRVLTEKQLFIRIKVACRGLEELVSADELLENTVSNFYEGIKEKEVDLAQIMAARTKIEIEPAYSKVAARLLLDVLYRETMEISSSDPDLESSHRSYFKKYIKEGIKLSRLHPDLLKFDLDLLCHAMQLQRDDQFTYLGLQTLYDRYFIHHEQRKLETPQIFWMRIAMGLAMQEEQKNERAIEFYN